MKSYIMLWAVQLLAIPLRTNSNIKFKLNHLIG